MKSYENLSKQLSWELSKDLVYSVQKNDFKTAKQALVAGASAKKLSLTDGSSVLHVAVSNDNYKIAELLLLEGADPNQAHEKNSTTPLYTAVGKGNHEMVSLLLDFGAKIEHGNGRQTPMDLAREKSPKCRAVLLNFLEKNPDTTHLYFNRAKKIIIDKIDRELNRWWCTISDYSYARKIKEQCESKTSIGQLIQLIESSIAEKKRSYTSAEHPLIRELQLREFLIMFNQLKKLEDSKAVVLDKKPDSDDVSTKKPTCVSSTSELNKILIAIPIKPSAPLASSVESEELAKTLKVSKVDQPRSSSVYPKLSEVSASSVAVEIQSADLQKAAGCKI